MYNITVENIATMKHCHLLPPDAAWADPGGPIFGKVNFITLHCIQCLKNIFEIEFGFYSGRNPGAFGSVGDVCVCVCVNRNRGHYCFLFCKGPILTDIRGHSDPKNICQIARNCI